MIRLRPLRVEDFEAFQNRDGEPPETEAVTKVKAPVAFTATEGERVIGAGGIVVPTPGVGLVWIAFGHVRPRDVVVLTPIIRRIVQDAVRSLGLRRLEAIVRADNPRNMRWIERLGFTRENGCARKYNPDGGDAVRYELVGC